MSVQFFPHLNGQLAYEDTGSGPLVVCLPSLGDLRQEYRFLAPRLAAAGYRVIQADLRGQGDSSPRWAEFTVPALGSDLLALIRHLDSGPAIVIGSSMSAASAVWSAVETTAAVETTTAVEPPAAISGLVLIGPAVRGSVPPLNQLLYRILFARPWGPALWAKYYTGLYPTRKPEDFPAYVAALRSNLQQPGRIAAALGLMLAPKTPAEQRLSSVRQPVRVIMGSRDPDFKDPTAEARWVTDRIRTDRIRTDSIRSDRLGGDYHIVAGAGHYPHAEMPEITAPLVLEFIRSLENRPEASDVPDATEAAHVA